MRGAVYTLGLASPSAMAPTLLFSLIDSDGERYALGLHGAKPGKPEASQKNHSCQRCWSEADYPRLGAGTGVRVECGVRRLQSVYDHAQ